MTARKPDWTGNLRDDLEHIYRQHRRSLYALASSVTGCSQLAEDAVHAAFERMCRRTDPASRLTVPWVYACIRNAAIDQLRRHQRCAQLAVDVFHDSAPPSGDTVDEHVLTEERDHILRAAVERLDAEDRDILLMKIYGQLTFNEIATVLGRPAATIATRYRRTLHTLQDRLKAQL